MSGGSSGQQQVHWKKGRLHSGLEHFHMAHSTAHHSTAQLGADQTGPSAPRTLGTSSSVSSETTSLSSTALLRGPRGRKELRGTAHTRSCTSASSAACRLSMLAAILGGHVSALSPSCLNSVASTSSPEYMPSSTSSAAVQMVATPSGSARCSPVLSIMPVALLTVVPPTCCFPPRAAARME
jgi:hypothetical protein